MCVCVCVYVCIYICVCIYIYIYMCVCNIYIYIYIYMCVCVCVCVYVCVCVLLHSTARVVWNILQFLGVLLHLKLLLSFSLRGSLSHFLGFVLFLFLHFKGSRSAYQESLCRGTPFVSSCCETLLQQIPGMFMHPKHMINMDHQRCTTIVYRVNDNAHLLQGLVRDLAVCPSMSSDNSQMFALAGIKFIYSCP